MFLLLPRTESHLNGQAGYNLAVAVDPLDPNRVWVGGIGIFRSDDGGANWGYAYNGAHPDQHFLAFDPGFDGAGNQMLYEVSDGGVYQTTQARGQTGTCASPNSAVTWTPLNNGYQTTQFYHGVPYPGGGAYFGGTQDNGTLRGTDFNGPGQWASIFGGDGGVSRVDPVNISTAFVETPHAALARSSDGGITYQSAYNGLNEAPAQLSLRRVLPVRPRRLAAHVPGRDAALAHRKQRRPDGPRPAPRPARMAGSSITSAPSPSHPPIRTWSCSE